MLKHLAFSSLFLLLTSCSLLPVHRPDVEQGNIIQAPMLAKIHHGMTEDEVIAIMGSPVLVNILSKNRMVYVYTLQPGYGNYTEKKVIFTFANRRLKTWDSSLP